MSHYDTLGIRSDANEAAIKSAYRSLAMRFHPDRNQGSKAAETRFKQISAAFEVLSSREARRAYDESLIAIPPRPQADPETQSRRQAGEEAVRDILRREIERKLAEQAARQRKAKEDEANLLIGQFVFGGATIGGVVLGLLTGSILVGIIGFVVAFLLLMVIFGFAVVIVERINA